MFWSITPEFRELTYFVEVKDTELVHQFITAMIWKTLTKMDFSFTLPSAPASTEPAFCFQLTALILHLTASNAHSGNHSVLMLSSYAAYAQCFEPL